MRVCICDYPNRNEQLLQKHTVNVKRPGEKSEKQHGKEIRHDEFVIEGCIYVYIYFICKAKSYTPYRFTVNRFMLLCWMQVRAARFWRRKPNPKQRNEYIYLVNSQTPCYSFRYKIIILYRAYECCVRLSSSSHKHKRTNFFCKLFFLIYLLVFALKFPSHDYAIKQRKKWVN